MYFFLNGKCISQTGRPFECHQLMLEMFFTDKSLHKKSCSGIMAPGQKTDSSLEFDIDTSLFYLSWWKNPWNICRSLWVCVGHSPAAQWSALYGLHGRAAQQVVARWEGEDRQEDKTTDSSDSVAVTGPLWVFGWRGEMGPADSTCGPDCGAWFSQRSSKGSLMLWNCICDHSWKVTG